MKKIFFTLAISLLFACNSEPFKPNKDNDLLVGKWKISVVDDSAALISPEEFLLTAMHKKYEKDYVFDFEKGPNFKLISANGAQILNGQYSIKSDSSSVTFLIYPDSTEISYDLEKKGVDYDLIVTTPGELVNLTVVKF